MFTIKEGEKQIQAEIQENHWRPLAPFIVCVAPELSLVKKRRLM
jgi:hypothetical protein